DDAFAHALAEIARRQHDRGGVLGIVAVAILLVTQAYLQRILVTGGADESGLAALVLDESVEAYGRAVDAEVAIRHDAGRALVQFLADQLQAVLDGPGRVDRRRQYL